MKKQLCALAMGSMMLLSSVFAVACNGGGENNPPNGGDKDPSTAGNEIIIDAESNNYVFNEMYKKGELKDEANGFSSADDIKGARYFVNGSYMNKLTSSTSRQDIKLELYNDNNMRFVNASAGMEFTLPSTEVSVDYSIAKYQTQFEFGDSVLTVSLNSQNPYTSNPNPWYTYCSEWLIRHLNNDTFMSNNGLTRLNGTKKYEFTESHTYGDLEFKQGYDVYRYDIRIDDEKGVVERPVYNIGIVRLASSNREFAMFVMKSKEDQKDVLDNIITSYKKIGSKGEQKNYFEAGDPKPDPNWNEETKEYYDIIINTRRVHWGVFSYSMPGPKAQQDPKNAYYQQILGNSERMQQGIEEAWDHNFDIYPTYTHIAWGDEYHYFPVNMANELAGGNGVNGKPVLQFTYQFTRNNNIVADEVTPMFDILRGVYDDYFHQLAKDVKKYGKPVLFRLNNEMNTDWTSYSGMMTLCDPDIFNMTWIRLYKIFEQEGVDNCIWIWNPIATSCPYSSWGEDLCYFPGVDYVQLLGGTNYEMNNYDKGMAEQKMISFKDRYSTLYNKNLPAFPKWVMILSEFACGSGGDYTGELGRNRDAQAKWVKEMFEAFAAEEQEAWVKTIKGAVWFNCNDMSGTKVTNRLRIYDPDSKVYNDLVGTMQAFKEGFVSLEKYN